MDLSDLPEELVEEIAEYLSKGDILACSHVNTLWRNAFNINRIWKRFCKLHPTYFDNYVNKLQLLPGEHFNHGCKSKEQFLKESKVKQNLSIGRFHTAELDCGSVYCDNVLFVLDHMSNHWMFVSCINKDLLGYKHILQVFNINDDPVIHISTNTTMDISEYEDITSVMKFENKKLFFIYDYTMSIYEFAYPCYEMKLVNLLYLKPEVKDIETPVIVLLSNHILQFYLHGDHSSNINQLNCNVFNHEGLLTNVNNVNAKSLLTNKYSYDDFESLSYLNTKSNGSDVVVVICEFSSDDEQDDCFDIARIFSVTKLDYLKFCMKFISVLCFDICENVIIFLSITRKHPNLKHMFVYFIENGAVHFDKNFSIPAASTGCQLVPGTKDVIISQTTCISVFDISLGMQINTFDLGYGISLSSVLSDSLLSVEFQHGKKEVKCVVWNFKCGMKYYELTNGKHYSDMVINNHYCPTKILQIQNLSTLKRINERAKIVLISFW